MSVSLDLNLLPVARYAGREYPELIGLHAAMPPRRSARGRNQDRLVLYLAMEGNAPLPPGQQSDLLSNLARLFYQTPGTVTAGLRRVADELNNTLLERNAGLERRGRQGLGLLAQVVVREQQLFLACSGPLHAYLVAVDSTRYVYDSEMEDRALGQAKTAPVTFFQANINPNDTLLVAAQPAPAWNTDALSGLHGQGPESLRRRLFAPATQDLNALMIQARPGKGKFFLPRPVAPVAVEPESQEQAPAAEPARPVVIAAPVAMAAADTPFVEDDLVSASPEPTAQAEMPALMPELDAFEPLPPEYPTTAENSALAEGASPSGPVSGRRRGLHALNRRLAGASLALAGGVQRLGRGLHSMLTRILPDETFLSIPTPVLVLIALAVPVVIVSIASMAYMRLGRQAQYEQLYQQAREMAVRAAAENDATTRRIGLEAAMQVLDQAERYSETPDTEELRSQMRSSLDELELVTRVDYQPAIVGGLPPVVNVVKLVPVDQDLYLLDGNSGGVLRAQLTDQGYAIDETFDCRPGTASALAIGPIIDILAWPAGYDPPATVLALDANGNALYCLPGLSSAPAVLRPGAEENWGDFSAFTLDTGNLYALDRAANQVWIYWRSILSEVPNPYFTEEDGEPPPLAEAVDMGINRDDLYLLNPDGSMILCIPNTAGAGPVRCMIQPFVDFRPGRENAQMIPIAPFKQMQITSPPEPALFTLEPQEQAIYHFSLRSLTFQKRYQPAESLYSQPATAFAVDTFYRNLYLAIGNNVYYGVLP